jgi:hypothetical protein
MQINVSDTSGNQTHDPSGLTVFTVSVYVRTLSQLHS